MTSINFLHGGLPLITRIMHFGGAQLSDYIGQVLMLKPQEAEDEKRKMSPPVQELVKTAISPPLKVKWRFVTKGAVKSSPVLWAEKVYFGSHDGNVYCLDASNGHELWRFPAGQPVEAPPLLLDGPGSPKAIFRVWGSSS